MMKTATIQEIKKELVELEPLEVRELCLKMAKFKKDNKELLTYLLFQSANEELYVEQIKLEITDQIKELTTPNFYYLKKGLRRILRVLNKQIRYSGKPQTEIELRIHFLEEIKKAKLPVSKSTVLTNLYNQQIKNIRKVIGKLHTDLQYDYERQLEKVELSRGKYGT